MSSSAQAAHLFCTSYSSAVTVHTHTYTHTLSIEFSWGSLSKVATLKNMNMEGWYEIKARDKGYENGRWMELARAHDQGQTLLLMVLNVWVVLPQSPHIVSCLVDQAVSHWLLTKDAQVHAQGSPCGIYGRQSGTGTRFSLSPLVFPCQNHFIIATLLYSLMLPSGRWMMGH
jgi:hypothetical protein